MEVAVLKRAPVRPHEEDQREGTAGLPHVVCSIVRGADGIHVANNTYETAALPAPAALRYRQPYAPSKRVYPQQLQEQHKPLQEQHLQQQQPQQPHQPQQPQQLQPREQEEQLQGQPRDLQEEVKTGLQVVDNVGLHRGWSMAGEILGGDLLRVVQPPEEGAQEDGDRAGDLYDTDQEQYYVTGVAKARLEMFHRQASLTRQLKHMGLPVLNGEETSVQHGQQPPHQPIPAWKEGLNGGGLGNLLQQRDRKAKARAAGRPNTVPASSARLQRYDQSKTPAGHAAAKIQLLSENYDSGVIINSKPISKPTHPSRQQQAAPSNEVLEGDMMGVKVRKVLSVQALSKGTASTRVARIAREATERQTQLRNLAAVIIAAHEQGVTVLGVPVAALCSPHDPAPAAHSNSQAKVARPLLRQSPTTQPYSASKAAAAATRPNLDKNAAAGGGGGGGSSSTVRRLQPQIRQQEERQAPPTFKANPDAGVSVVQYSRRETVPLVRLSRVPKLSTTIHAQSLANVTTRVRTPSNLVSMPSTGVTGGQTQTEQTRGSRQTVVASQSPGVESVTRQSTAGGFETQSAAAEAASGADQMLPPGLCSTKPSNLLGNGDVVLAQATSASPSASSKDVNPWDKFGDLSEDEEKLPGGVRVARGSGKGGGKAAVAVKAWQAEGSGGDDDDSGEHSSDGSDGGVASSWGVSSQDSLGYPLQFAMPSTHPFAAGRDQVIRRRVSSGGVLESEGVEQPPGQLDAGLMLVVDSGSGSGEGGASREGSLSEVDDGCAGDNFGDDEDFDDDVSTGSWGVRQPEQRKVAVVAGSGAVMFASATAEAAANVGGLQAVTSSGVDGGLDELMRRLHVGAHQQRVVHPRDVPQLALTPAPAWLLEPLPWYKGPSAGDELYASRGNSTKTSTVYDGGPRSGAVAAALARAACAPSMVDIAAKIDRRMRFTLPE